MGTLDGKSAVVTGGSRGIGRAIVRRLAAEGAAVVFSYYENQQAAEEVMAAATGAGGRAVALRADQGSPGDQRRLLTEADRLHGGLDILVNNAALARGQRLADVTEDEFDRTMAVNAKGPFFAMQHAARLMRDGGRIINISTLSTALPEGGAGLYVASKGALEQFTKTISRELGRRGITVNAISPGATDTAALRGENPEAAIDAYVRFTALRRLGQPDDIASVVAFLAGPDAAWVTGENLRVSGGLLV